MKLKVSEGSAAYKGWTTIDHNTGSPGVDGIHGRGCSGKWEEEREDKEGKMRFSDSTADGKT